MLKGLQAIVPDAKRADPSDFLPSDAGVQVSLAASLQPGAHVRGSKFGEGKAMVAGGSGDFARA